MIVSWATFVSIIDARLDVISMKIARHRNRVLATNVATFAKKIIHVDQMQFVRSSTNAQHVRVCLEWCQVQVPKLVVYDRPHFCVQKIAIVTTNMSAKTTIVDQFARAMLTA
jgi:hypothetical protein